MGYNQILVHIFQTNQVIFLQSLDKGFILFIFEEIQALFNSGMCFFFSQEEIKW
jgi:hypothetical protein